MRLIFFFALYSLVLQHSAAAEIVNAVDTMNTRLKTLGSFHISDTCRNVCIATEQYCNGYWYSDLGPRRCTGYGTRCTATQNQCTKSMGSLTVSKLSGVVAKEHFGEIQRTSAPDEWYRQSLVYANCTGGPQTVSKNLTISYNRGHRSTVTKAVSTGTSMSIGVTAKFGMVGLSGSYSVKESISLSEAKSTSSSQAVTVSTSTTLMAANKKQRSVVLNVVVRNYSLPVKASIVVDGYLDPNLSKYAGKKLSDVLSEADRTLVAEVLLEATFGSDDFLKGDEIDIECKSQDDTRIVLNDATKTVVDDSTTVPKVSKSLDKENGVESYLNGVTLGGLRSMALKQTLFNTKENEKFPGVIAEGSHQCQSRNSIGHRCQVFGPFADCFDAETAMGADDCCFATAEGGTSIGFTMNYCAPF